MRQGLPRNLGDPQRDRGKELEAPGLEAGPGRAGKICCLQTERTLGRSTSGRASESISEPVIAMGKS